MKVFITPPLLKYLFLIPEAEFKEFEPRPKFETRLKYDWLY